LRELSCFEKLPVVIDVDRVEENPFTNSELVLKDVSWSTKDTLYRTAVPLQVNNRKK
jgi:hypothetical protein